MKMLSFVLYKEFLQMKSDKGTIAGLLLPSVGLGLLMPTIMYLRLVEVLPPVGLGMFGLEVGLTEEQRIALMQHALGAIIPLLLPFFMSMSAVSLAIPSIAGETESRTLERLLSLPLSWRNLFVGKLLFFFMVSLACAYIMALVYFFSIRAFVEGFQIADFHIYLSIFVPAVVLYTVSMGLFVSARARTVSRANLYGHLLTGGLFLAIFFVTRATGLELGPHTMLPFAFILFAVGLVLAYYAATRVNPEKLLYGS
ncbi:ABC transporter permease subunit [Dehalococcoidia bacterium]|nr:ABC transporter permease subunit [Dehalococcoidia bacterium]